MRSVIPSRHDPRWHPGLGDPSALVAAYDGRVYRSAVMPVGQVRHLRVGDVFQLRQNAPPRGLSRNSRDWRPGLGEISTAEWYANELGIPYRLGLRGLGQGAPTPGEQQVQQISAIASSGASATVGILVALGTVSGPVGAAIGGLITVGQLLVGVFKGCGQTCIEATDIVNQVEPILQQNVTAYVNSPVRTQSMQAAALNNFQTAWNAVVQNCSNPSLGQAGQNCISQRQQGACAYKTSPGGWNSNGTYTFPGGNGSGSACWNWFIGYHDPIANDPNVQPDSAVTSPASTTAPSSTGTAATTPAGVTGTPDLTPLLLIGGLALLLVLL